MTERRVRCWCGRPVPRRWAVHEVVECGEHVERDSAPAPVKGGNAERCPICGCDLWTGHHDTAKHAAARTPITDVPSGRRILPQVSPSPVCPVSVFLARISNDLTLATFGRPLEVVVVPPEQRPVPPLGGHTGAVMGAAVRMPGRPTLDAVEGQPGHVPIVRLAAAGSLTRSGDVCATCGGDGFLFHLFAGAVELDGPCPTCQERSA